MRCIRSDISTAEWAIKYKQAEGAHLAQVSEQSKSSRTKPSPTFDPAYDYNSYSAQQDKTTGRLIVSAEGIRFVSNLGYNVLWSISYQDIQTLEKRDRLEHKHVPNKLQCDSGQDLIVLSNTGREYQLKKVDRRNEVFAQILGFSKINWQVVW